MLKKLAARVALDPYLETVGMLEASIVAVSLLMLVAGLGGI